MKRITIYPAKSRWPLGLASVIAAALAVALAWPSRHDRVETVAVGASPLQMATATKAATPQMTPSSTKATTATMLAAPSPAQQVDKLSKSSSPVDAFFAYNILRACVGVRRAESEVYENEPSHKAKPSAAACGDVTPAQIVSRLQLLDRAGLAGVHGAMYAASLEGPDGSGATGNENVSTPEYAAWTARLQQYQQAGVRTGDRASLMSLSQRYENERDMPKALTYWVAQAELSKPSHTTENIIARLSKTMLPDQAAAAIEQGKQIARAAHPVEGDQQ